MTILLICMIPVSALFGFVLCVLLSAASAADRQEEKCFAAHMENENKERNA